MIDARADMRRLAVESLDREREHFEAGDPSAIMRAMRICADFDLSMPAWLAHAFIAASDQVNAHKAKSWDDVLGAPHPKGKHLAAMRKKRDKGFAAWLAVTVAHEQHGRPIGEALFAEVGKELALNKTLVSELYYERKAKYEKT